MAKVRIVIEYDDAEEEGTAQWSAFACGEGEGPSLSIERDGKPVVNLAWFRVPAFARSWRSLFSRVLDHASHLFVDDGG